MKYKLVTVEEFTVAGLKINTTKEDKQSKVDVPRVRKELMDRKMELREIMNERTLYDVCWVHDEKDLMRFTFIACYEVAPDGDIPNGMTKITIPGGKYVVFSHRGWSESILKTWEEIPKTMLSSGYNYDNGKIMFTSFDERFIMNNDSIRSIHIPIF